MNKDIFKMVLTLTIVSAIAASSLAKIYDATKDKIAEAKRQEMLRAIKTVLPDFNNEPDKDLVELVSGKDKKGQDVKVTFYRGKKDDKIIGVAFKSSSMEGYSGLIEVMVGVDPAGTVSAIEVVSHAETPGLGDKIAFSAFEDQYKGKSLQNANWLVKKDGGDFFQLTGATISPRAVTEAVKKGLDFFAAHKSEILG
ncbi:MAG: RnfABCDGE type electron transport complex subunit G [bacterium]|nr:RnfABCDGE type electron transport complex subunit G [bacterium]